MSWLAFAFDRPEYLWLLVALPLVWWIGQVNLGGLGTIRRWAALCIRSAVVVLIVLALAELQLVRVTERVAAYFLLDQSLSVQSAQRERSLDYVRTATEVHRDATRRDLAGVIAFGRDAQIEQSLSDGGIVTPRLESAVDAEQSNLQSSLRLARATFPQGPARRVVVVSDGNENLGDALIEAQTLARDGIGIDVAMLPTLPQPDVVVERVTAPTGARFGSPFDVTVLLNHHPAASDDTVAATGRVVVVRKASGIEQLIAEEDVSLPPGKRVLTFRQELREPGFYVYDARFVPSDPGQDRVAPNNQATAFTQVEGKGRLLFVVNSESPDEFDHLIARLRANEIDVTVQSSDTAFAGLVDLQQYDGVVLANVPRVGGVGDETLTRFTDEQVQMLVQNVEQLGAGLVMLGGPDSFGAGGWTGTELEKAMPVDFQVKNAEVRAVGALMLVIDRSGSMAGEKLQMSKAAARGAVQMLGETDMVGIISFDVSANEDVKLQTVGEKRNRILNAIAQIGQGGGTDMSSSVRLGYQRLATSGAAVKHMIILTDGQTNGTGYEQLAAQNKRRNITTTTVAIGPDAAKGLLQGIANQGGGKYYQVNNPKAIPKIFMRETRRVMRPLVFETDRPMQPSAFGRHPVLSGIDGELPPITGYVLTTPKEHPLVEIGVAVPLPAGQVNPLLASWTYGLGHTAVFTTDSGQRWAKPWVDWEKYDQLFVQLVRWSMRPIGNQGNFNIASDMRDGKLHVVVTALTQEGDFLNGLSMHARATLEGSAQSEMFPLKQTAPGRYVASTELNKAGSYLISIVPGKGHPLLRAGISVPSLQEYKDRATNENLLISLAALTPKDGKPGEVIRLPDDSSRWREFRGPNVFRSDLAFGRSLTSMWPWVVLGAALLFLGDVFQRRVLIPSPWPLLQRLFAPRAAANPREERLERLKTTKALAASARFTPREPTEQLSIIEEAIAIDRGLPEQPQEAPSPEPQSPQSAEAETYAERLLRVKRQLRGRGQEPS